MIIVRPLEGYDALAAKFRSVPRVVEKATASALNKLGRQGATAAKRSITDTYNVKSGDAATAITVTPAKASYSGRDPQLFVAITARGDRLGLHKFGGLPALPPNQKGVPVSRRKTPTVKILKKAPRRPVTPDKNTGHGPFVARMRSGHVGIFVRTDRWTQKRQAIRELKSRGLAEMFQKTGTKALDKMLAEKGRAQLEHELEYYFDKELKK